MSWKEEAKQKAREMSEGARFKLEPGENTFRILPDRDNPKSKPYREIRTHYNVGPDKLPQRCGLTADGKGSCWLCQAMIPKLAQSEQPQKRQYAVKLAAKPGIVMQVSRIDRETHKFGPPKPWTVDESGPRGAATIIMRALGSDRRNFEDLDRGYNITLERFGTGIKTTYGTLMPDERPSVVPPAVRTAMKGLAELVYPYSQKEQEAAFKGAPIQRDRDDEDEDLSPPDDDLSPPADDDGADGQLLDNAEGYQEGDGDAGDDATPPDDDSGLPTDDDYQGEADFEDQIYGDDYVEEELAEPEPPPPPPPSTRRAAPKPPAPAPPSKRTAPVPLHDPRKTTTFAPAPRKTAPAPAARRPLPPAPAHKQPPKKGR